MSSILLLGDVSTDKSNICKKMKLLFTQPSCKAYIMLESSRDTPLSVYDIVTDTADPGDIKHIFMLPNHITTCIIFCTTYHRNSTHELDKWYQIYKRFGTSGSMLVVSVGNTSEFATDSPTVIETQKWCKVHMADFAQLNITNQDDVDTFIREL